MTADVCPNPECASVDRSVRGDVPSILLGKSIKCRNEWHDEPAPREPKSLLREPSKPPGKTGVEFVDRLSDQWGARQSAALRGDMTSIKNADMWLGIIAKEYWGEIIASLRKTHASPPAEPVSATPSIRSDYIMSEIDALLRISPERFAALRYHIKCKVMDMESELAEAKRKLDVQTHAAEALGRLVADKDKDRIFFRDELTKSEARAAELQAKLAAETARADGAHNAAIDKCAKLVGANGHAAILMLKVPQ